jgi:transmembrane sensor
MSDLGRTESFSPGSAADVRHRAAAWIVKRRDSEDWNEADQAQLDGWLAQSPAHKIAYLRVEAAWQRADRLGGLRRPAPSRRGFAPLLKFVGMGAAAAIALGGVYLAAPWQTQSPGKRFVTGVGGRETLTLHDGSKIELNTSTALRISDDGSRRTVWLDKGEAYFQIVHSDDHPFVVFAGKHRITDLGTKFLVRRDDKALRVALFEGKAQFDTRDGRGFQEAILNPGDVVVATAKSLSISERSGRELKDALSWRNGLLVFRHATLAQAAAEYNRYNLKKIVIADPKVAKLNINGSLPANDPNAFTRSVKRFFDLHIEDRPNEIVITR